MSKSPSTRNERLGGLTRVSRAVAAFEAAWQAAKGENGSAPPRLEVFLEAIPEAEPLAYLRELLAVELECRTKQGEIPALEDYQARFPAHAEAIQAVFAERGLVSVQEKSTNQFATLSFDCPVGDF